MSRVHTVTAMSTVPELISFLRYSFQEDQFAEVETMLMNREKGFRMELEKLRKDNDILKQERDLMERKHGSVDLEKLRFEDELRKSKREYDELNEKLVRLNEDHKMLNDGKNMVEERCKMLLEELLEAEKENSRIVVEFSEKIESLKGEKREMEGKVEVYKRRFKELDEKVLKLEEGMVEIKGVDVRAIRGEANVAAEEEKEACFTALGGGKESLSNGGLGNGVNVGLPSSGVCLECNSARSGSRDSPKEGSHPTDLACGSGLHTEKQLTSEAGGGSNKLIHPSREITGRLGSAAIIIDLSESDDDMPKRGTKCVSNIEEINSGEQDLASLKSLKNDCSSLESEKNEGACGESHLMHIWPKRKRSTTESDDDDNIPLSKRKTKLILELIDDRKSSLSIFSPDVAETVSSSKFNSAFIKRCEEKAGTGRNPQLPLTNASSEYDSYIDNMVVANFRSDRENTWIYAADMLSAFKKDPVLCMNAVCALYRQQISASRSIKSFSLFKNGGFSSLDTLRGTAVAKYLINNDPDYKLSRSISEVREKHPEMLEDCERLATQYYDQIFEIYRKKLDPFFCPKL